MNLFLEVCFLLKIITLCSVIVTMFAIENDVVSLFYI